MRQMVQSGTFEKFELSQQRGGATAAHHERFCSPKWVRFALHLLFKPKYQIGFVRHISDNYYLYSNKPRTSTEALSYFNGSKDSAP